MRRVSLHKTNTAGWLVVVALAASLASCGTQEPDFSKNEGAVAWLAHHNGTIPASCLSQLIDREGIPNEINDEIVDKTVSDAMQLAGSTYTISLAEENLIVALETVLQVEKEGVAQGYTTEQAVRDAQTKLNEAISRRIQNREELASLDKCEFTATDQFFGFKDRSLVY